MLLCGHTAMWAQEFYCSTLSDINGWGGPSYVKSTAGSYEKIGRIDPNDPGVVLNCGANCNGTYYGITHRNGVPQSVVTVNWKTGATTTFMEIPALPTVQNLFQLTDMAYNFATKKLYGLKTDDGVSKLYPISIDTQYNEMLPDDAKKIDMGVNILTFDFAADGTMYALVSKADAADGYNYLWLYTYDKDLQPAQQVQVMYGAFAQKVIINQNMKGRYSCEMDQKEGKLYFTRTDDYEQFVKDIDLATGTIGTSTLLGKDETWVNYFNAINLYIPFEMASTDIAGPVTGLTAKGDAEGAMKVNISWTNPTKNFGKGDLDELYSVRIYRNEADDASLLAELTSGVTVGGEMQWTDENASAGTNKYVIVPCRVKGEKGTAETVEAWAGYDVPAKVADVRTKLTAKGVMVTWEEPTGTMHGGPMDMASLTYDVKRRPDNITVATDLTAREVLDEKRMPVWQDYTYYIIPKTSTGMGEAFEGTSYIYAGPNVKTPFVTSFDNYMNNYQWTYINANNDELGGWFDQVEGMYYTDALYYNDTDAKQVDEWIMTPYMDLAPGQYKMTVQSYIRKTGTTNKFSLTLGHEPTPEAQASVLEECEFTATGDKQIDQVVVEFTIQEAGTYNTGVHLTAQRNDGVNNRDARGLGIAYYKLEMIGDAPQDPAEVVMTGNPANATLTWLTPIDANSPSLNEAIYTREMLGLRKGDVVTKISYLGMNTTATPVTGTLKGWIGNTQYEGYMADDIAPMGTDGMTQFADLTFTLPQLGQVDEYNNFIMDDFGTLLEMPLAQPYNYDGTNMHLVYESALDNYSTKFSFLAVDEEEAANVINTITKRTKWYDFYTRTFQDPILMMDVVRAPTELFSVTGMVQNREGNPVEGANVAVVYGKEIFEATTDAEGKFSIEAEGVQDKYNLFITKQGYKQGAYRFNYEGYALEFNDLVLDAIEDGITGIAAGGNRLFSVHDTAGRLIKTVTATCIDDIPLKQGVYIINGKKYLRR